MRAAIYQMEGFLWLEVKSGTIVIVFGLLFLSACENSSIPDAAYYKKQNFASKNSYDSIQEAIDAYTDIGGDLDQVITGSNEDEDENLPIEADQLTSGVEYQ